MSRTELIDMTPPLTADELFAAMIKSKAVYDLIKISGIFDGLNRDIYEAAEEVLSETQKGNYENKKDRAE